MREKREEERGRLGPGPSSLVLGGPPELRHATKCGVGLQVDSGNPHGRGPARPNFGRECGSSPYGEPVSTLPRPEEFDHLAFARSGAPPNGDDPVAGQNFHAPRSRKRPERGQHAHPIAGPEPEAPGPNAVRRPRQRNGRVEVAAEHIRPAVGLIRFVGERQLTVPGFLVRPRHHAHAPVRGWIARPDIVIAAHQQHVERSVACPPRRHRLHGCRRPPACGVDEIAEDHQSARRESLDEQAQAREVFRRGLFGNRHPARPECRRLAEVRVRDAERCPARPPEGAIRERVECLTAPVERGRVRRASRCFRRRSWFCQRHSRSLAKPWDSHALPRRADFPGCLQVYGPSA